MQSVLYTLIRPCAAGWNGGAVIDTARQAATPLPPPSVNLKHNLPQGVARFDLGMGDGGVFERQCPADFYG